MGLNRLRPITRALSLMIVRRHVGPQRQLPRARRTRMCRLRVGPESRLEGVNRRNLKFITLNTH
jgi:hypothetical protein